MNRPSLRWYQEEAVNAIMSRFETDRSTMLVAATGAGKTQMFSEVALRFLSKGRVLVLAHRKELVHQAAARLHLVTGIQPDIEMAEEWSGSRADIVCASLQTIIKRLERWERDHFALIVFDECFPAGTLVDGRPIESIRVGDSVASVCHKTGVMQRRSVVRLFEKQAHHLVKLRYGATSLTCTGNHPVFVKGRGYVEAQTISPGDLLCVRKGIHLGSLEAGDLQRRVSRCEVIGNYDAHQPSALQSDEAGGLQGEAARHTQSHRAQTASPRRERSWNDETPGEPTGGPGLRMGARGNCEDRETKARGSTDPLQAGPRAQGADDLHRGGRGEPQFLRQEGSRPEEDSVFEWVRVDCIESVQCGSDGTTVYNLEVEGSHTYFANDTLVHNCHHSIATSFRKPLEYFASAKLLGVTATPDRGDGKAMGKFFQSVAYTFDIVDGIQQGYLVPIKGRTVTVEEINLSGVQKSAGDLQVGQLDEAMVEGVEGIVSKTLELEPDRQGIWFFPGVKSAELACDRINALKPGSAAFVCGETPPEERDQIVGSFRRGTVQHLCNCQVATEGFDAPSASMVVIGRPTLSRALYAQMVGRGLRVLPGVVDGHDSKDLADFRKKQVAESPKPDCVVIDFCGNSGKHTLVTPEDLLGGDYSDEEKKEAKRLSKENPGTDVIANLQKARSEIKAMMSKLQSQVKATVQAFNPFEAFKLDRAGGGPPINPHQRDALAKFKVKPAEMDGLSQEAAAKLIRTLGTRMKLGLASVRQLDVLKKHGVTQTNIRFRTASQAIDYIASTGWKPDPVVLARMVSK